MDMLPAFLAIVLWIRHRLVLDLVYLMITIETNMWCKWLGGEIIF
jgi:hypothetical protein